MRTSIARWSLSAAVFAAAGLALTACSPTNATPGAGGHTGPAASSSAEQPAAKPDTGSDQGAAPGKPAGIRKKAGVSCTNQINYANDSRSNADINTIGEETGYCPPISAEEDKTEPAGIRKKAGVSCTNQINYANDSRSNADINTIGEETGYCPPISADGN